MALARVTLTLDRQLVEEARVLSGGNFSRFISRLLEERLEELRRQRLREELRAGYLAEAVHDLEIAEEYRFVDGETALREET
jgi:post-segregation antitoxin (ccd killing protein)